MQSFPRYLPTVPAGLLVKAVAVEPTRIVITARAIATNGAACPACRTVTRRVHSRYWRTLADLPWHDRSVVWHLQVRRFRCSRCERRIFAERLPGIAVRKGRRTTRLAEAQTCIGLALGGEPGARLACKLAMPVSGDTILRLIRRLPLPPHPVEFPRFDGHSSGLMRRCLNVAIPSSISAGVSSADGGTGPRWP
jgi:transposase IS204/IS1001/IS1096/IS1165 family protein